MDLPFLFRQILPVVAPAISFNPYSNGSSFFIDYQVVSLLIHYIKKGDIIQIESDTYNGDLKIIAIDINDFKMTLKTKALNKVGG